MEHKEVVLYTIDSKERARVWVCMSGIKDGKPGIFYTDGIVGGKMKDATFKEAKEKNVGKTNYISPEEQAILMVDMEAGKKLRSNYFYTIEEATVNKLWLPMLAHKYEDYGSKISYPRISQPKLDGARCNIYWSEREGKVVVRTRTGKDYFTTIHIEEQLKELLMANRNVILDGELYNHSLHDNFEEIMSLIRKSKPTQEDLKEIKKVLQYHIYDVYLTDYPDATFDDRYKWLDNNLPLPTDGSIQLVSTETVTTQEQEDELQELYLQDGYEGQMIRDPRSTYKVDGRSQELLKRKEFTDAEFEIVDLEEGTGDWKGAVKKVIIKLPDGRVQGCGIDGSYELNQQRLINKESLVGKLATVRFFRYTHDGFLYIPVCKDIDRQE